MELLGDEMQATWIDFQHVLTALAGLVILIYIIIYGRNSRDSSQQDLKRTATSRPHAESEDYINCQLPNCVRCKPSKDNQLLWKERVGKFYEKQTAEDQILLEDLFKSFWTQKDGVSGNGDKTLELQNPTLYSYPKLQGIPWYDSEAILSVAHRKDIQTLKDQFEVIKQDFENVYSSYTEGIDRGGWSQNNVPSGSWIVFHLYNQGRRVQENCQRCPETVGVLESLKTFMRGVSFGYACFSVLQPNSHITPHYGPCNIRLRCHLGIQIPAKCSLTVAGETKMWQVRDCLLFDDSFIHEATNANEGSAYSDIGSRVILMVDLWHPDLSDLERDAFKEVLR